MGQVVQVTSLNLRRVADKSELIFVYYSRFCFPSVFLFSAGSRRLVYFSVAKYLISRNTSCTIHRHRIDYPGQISLQHHFIHLFTNFCYLNISLIFSSFYTRTRVHLVMQKISARTYIRLVALFLCLASTSRLLYFSSSSFAGNHPRFAQFDPATQSQFVLFYPWCTFH